MIVHIGSEMKGVLLVCFILLGQFFDWQIGVSDFELRLLSILVPILASSISPDGLKNIYQWPPRVNCCHLGSKRHQGASLPAESKWLGTQGLP